VAYWQQDVTGADLTRAYGQTGVRASLPFWKANPAVQSILLNLNGMAHKVTLDAEFYYADASRDSDQLPLYNPLNDDAQEHFERRMRILGGTFVGAPESVLAKFDTRYFALRSGMQGNVTAPVTEIADDMLVLRGGIRQRWQTKRGMPGQQRIIDWIGLDLNATYFPKPQLDPFGETANLNEYVGLVDYNFFWHIGDRLSLLSDGYIDTFGGGLRTISVGGVLNRPDRGRLYLGYRHYEGPFTSDVVAAAVNYRMSEKWSASLGATVDLGKTGNIGQRVRITRIGESLLMSLGFSFDATRDNVGIQLAIEPRFMSPGRLRRVAGVTVEPAGLYGLE
jgi:hypothetical protein